jgi:enoyl-CoA hydratase/carnithine racemase
MPTLERQGKVFLLDLGSDENRWTPTWMESFGEHLDRIESSPGARALVTLASGKYWSTGLDLAWLEANPKETRPIGRLFLELLARMLTLPVPCVAAIQGHAVGAGAMLAIAHDFRVMSSEQGRLWFPEVDLHLSFTDGVSALIQAKLSPPAAHRSMLTGHRWSAVEAHAAGIVDAVATSDQVTTTALDLATSLAAKDGGTLGAIKRRMYANEHSALLDDAAAVARGDSVGDWTDV